MAGSSVRQQEANSYFSLIKQQISLNISPSSFDFNQDDESPIESLASCDSFALSPLTPNTASPVSLSGDAYTLPSNPSIVSEKSEGPFSFGAFEDWMVWDDPADQALSPVCESQKPSGLVKMEPMSPNLTMLDLQAAPGSQGANSISVDPLSISNNLDDCTFNDSLNDEPLFQSPQTSLSPQLSRLPSRGGLYSTPLSWERPQLSKYQYGTAFPPLSRAEEEKLRSIAMPIKQEAPLSPSSASSPEDSHIGRKRKNSADDEEDDEFDSDTGARYAGSRPRHAPVKKTSHNMIEKRYRTNLNEKIAMLRDSVPSLRIVSKKNEKGKEMTEDLQGLTPAHKLNKATVLAKATEYITHLEKCNKHLAKENQALKSRLEAFEVLLMARSGDVLPRPSHSSNSSSASRPRPPHRYSSFDGRL